MKTNAMKIEVNALKTALSSKSLFYKTENFIQKTKYISDIDFLATKLGEAICVSLTKIVEGENKLVDDISCFSLQTADKQFSFDFRFGYQVGNNLSDYDIIFTDFTIGGSASKQTINDYLRIHSTLSVTISRSTRSFSNRDYAKLYLVTNASGIKLPRLSPTQREIVETLDKNILVQGVAGSGKTNLCIDKIIFTACRNYSGKTLYTTFSRGLLTDTKLKLENYISDLEKLLNDYKLGRVVFLDSDHKRALENKLGIYFFSDDDDKLFAKIERIIDYLSNKVDYLLIEDLYKATFNADTEFVGERYFIREYIKNTTNHQVEKAFQKLNAYSKEIIFKEIYGMIFGFYQENNFSALLPLDKYTQLRSESFSRQECEAIYLIAQDYRKTLEQKGLTDNNLASKILLPSVAQFSYSLAVIDEVQDYTQVNLALFRKMSLKMFCVGDALQMINPSYFNFGYLKNLMFEKDVTEVRELKHNFRNTKKISEIIDTLGEINKQEFGTHNFVIKGESVDSGEKTTALFLDNIDFAKRVADGGFEDITFVTADVEEKQKLQAIVKRQEVLTVSEIKGLERNNVVCYRLLSANEQKWRYLLRQKVNRKQADENSVFRYYYNLFYVGVSRARQNLFVLETEEISQFTPLFNKHFERKNTNNAIEILSTLVRREQFSQRELNARVEEFIKLEQFDNARFTASKINEDVARINALRTIEVHETFVSKGKYREAGIRFWEYGLIDQAKNQFTLSGDTILIELVDRCSKSNNSDLNIDIVDYFDDVRDNPLAQSFIVETVQKDVRKLKESFSRTKELLKQRGGKNG